MSVRANTLVKPIALRERNKEEKRSRIKQAAKTIFRERGYKDATTRDIAEAAYVAPGTLFRYAKDKRELLFMVCNDELDEATDAALKEIPKHAHKDLVSQLVGFYRPRYMSFARHPELSRDFVRESFFLMSAHEEPGPEAKRNRSRRAVLVNEVTKLIQRNQEEGKVARDVKPQEASYLLHSLYLSDSRQWLEDEVNPKVDTGMNRLKRLFTIAVRGITP